MYLLEDATGNADVEVTTYLENGVFYPVLTISDTNNCQSIINLDTVRSGISNIDFIGTNTEGCASLDVNFTNLAPDAVDFYWDFGDNTFSTEPNPEHTYDSVGLYSEYGTCLSAAA